MALTGKSTSQFILIHIYLIEYIHISSLNESNDKNAFVFLLMILFVHVCLYDLLISVQMKLYNNNESLRICIIDYSDKDVTVDKENVNNFTLANVIFKAIKCILFKSIVEFLL
jgi:hypothetical protein